MSNGRIVAEQKRGLLQLTVWANQGSKGTYYTATLKRSYKDQSDQWQETKMSLPLRDFLQMARMLGWAYTAQMKRSALAQTSSCANFHESVYAHKQREKRALTCCFDS